MSDEDEGQTEIEYRVDYYSASGTGTKDCAFLAQRYERATGFRLGTGESIIAFGTVTDGPRPLAIRTAMLTTGWYTRLWRSEDKVVFVSTFEGKVLSVLDVSPRTDYAWTTWNLDGSLMGVWGLSANDVFAWGRLHDEPVLYRFDGQRWNSIRAPNFEIQAMHGDSEDRLFAVGPGMVARWEGGTWREFRTPVQELLVNVYVAGPGEYYAVGNQGSVLEGSDYGWTQIGAIPNAEPGDVQAVCKWSGHVWVGATRMGLFRRKGLTHEWEQLKKTVTAISFDTRGPRLLIGCDDKLAETEDGETFTGGGRGIVEEMREGRPYGE